MLALESYELAQIRNERSTLRLLREAEVLELIIENKPMAIIIEAIKSDKKLYQDLIDNYLLEQARRDQWNKQWGFLLESLGYEEVRYDKNLQEGFFGDIMIDIAWTVLPPLIRGLGTYFTGGAGALPANSLAMLVASGGAAYYAYFAVEAMNENRRLDAFFNFLNCLFSLEQAKIPVVSAAIAAAGRAAMRIISGFFRMLTAPFRALFNFAKTGFVKVANTKIAQKVYQPIAEFLSSGAGRALPESSSAIKAVGEKGTQLTEFFVGEVKNVLKQEKIAQTLKPKQIASLEAILTRFEGEIAGPMSKFAEEFGKNIKNVDDVLARGAAIESIELQKACHQLVEAMNLASGPGGVLEGTIKHIDPGQLRNLSRAYFSEGAAQLSKSAALAIEKELAQMTAAFGSNSLVDVGKQATNALKASGMTGLEIIGKEGKLIAKNLSGVEKPLAEFLSSSMRSAPNSAAAQNFYKDVLTAVGKTQAYESFLQSIGKASPELARNISKNSGPFLQSIVESFDITKAITTHYHTVLRDPSIMQAAGYTGRIGTYKTEQYMASWVAKNYPNFKAWPKLAKALQIGIGASTATTKGGSQTYAEREARKQELAGEKAKEIAKEKKGSIKSRKENKIEKPDPGIESFYI